jgi:hypothetical protein
MITVEDYKMADAIGEDEDKDGSVILKQQWLIIILILSVLMKMLVLLCVISMAFSTLTTK